MFATKMAEENTDHGGENLVLICVDACDHSLRAFDWFNKYVYNESHTVGLVNIYVPPSVPTYANGLEVYNEQYPRWLDDAVKKSESITAKFQGLCNERGFKARAFNIQKTDSVGHTICKLAKEKHATCVVMGQRGLGAVKRAVLGSVSDYVLHHAHITVLVVPHPKKEEDESKHHHLGEE